MRRAALAVLASVALTAFGGARVFYVSPQGNDALDGASQANAFRTIERARDAARGFDGTARIVLADGEYELSETLEFTGEDRNLVIVSQAGARPVISAGKKISGWKVDGRGWWRSRTEPGELYSQFYVNSQRRLRPTLPRNGYYLVERGLESEDAKARFAVKEGLFPKGDNPGLELCMFNVWTMSRSRVLSYDASSRSVKIDLPPGRTDFDTIGKGRWFRYDNVKSALGAPGDWYHDVDARELVYVPMPGEEPEKCEARAARLDCAVRLSSSTNITWRGIAFAYQGYGVQSGGNYCGQAATKEPDAVQIVGCRGVRFEQCAFVHTASYAVGISGGSVECVLENCELRDLGAGGVKIGEGRFVRGKTEMTRRCAVKNCLISEGGRVNPAGVGVWIGHAKENLVSHNTIRDLYYSGVSAGWNWSFNETARDNIIEWNHIYGIGRGVLSDMGGIYLLGSQPGTVERFNYIHDITRARNCAFGIYFDSGTSHVVVSNNVVHDCQDSNFFLAAISASNRVVNNIFAFGPGRQLHAAGRNPKSSPTRFERNIVVWDEGVFVEGFPGEEAISLAGNLYCAPEEARPKNAPRGGEYVGFPFADAKKRDFSFVDAAPAKAAGFIPFSLAGVGCDREGDRRMTAHMPPVPHTFPSAPDPQEEDIKEDYEEEEVGALASGWSVLDPDGTNTVRVTDAVAFNGRKALEIVDDKKDWRPHLYRSVGRTSGVVRLSFAIRIEGNAQPRLELRGSAGSINLRVAADGVLSFCGENLVRLNEGEWTRIGLEFRLGSVENERTGRLVVMSKNGSKENFNVKLPRRFKSFGWIGVHSCGNKGRYCLDEFRLVQAPVRRK